MCFVPSIEENYLLLPVAVGDMSLLSFPCIIIIVIIALKNYRMSPNVF